MMNTREELIKAIEGKHPVTFIYTKKSGDSSTREGNPHILYIYTTKKGESNIKLGMFQTGGESSTSVNNFKDFLSLEDISDVVVKEDENFSVDTTVYNPNSDRYSNVLKKV